MAKLKTSSLTFLNSSEQGTHGRRTSRPNIYVAGGFARGVAKVRLSLGELARQATCRAAVGKTKHEMPD